MYILTKRGLKPEELILQEKNNMLKRTPIWIRTVAATMLVAMVYYFAGYKLVYIALTHNARQEASNALKNKNVVLEKLSLKESEYNTLTWTEGHKEFMHKGQLYDIVSVTKLGNTYLVQAYSDKNETQWVKALNNFVKQLFPSTSNSNKTAESIIVAFQKEYMPTSVMCIISPDATLIKQYSQPMNIANLCSDTSIWHPPTCC